MAIGDFWPFIAGILPLLVVADSTVEFYIMFFWFFLCDKK